MQGHEMRAGIPVDFLILYICNRINCVCVQNIPMIGDHQ